MHGKGYLLKGKNKRKKTKEEKLKQSRIIKDWLKNNKHPMKDKHQTQQSNEKNRKTNKLTWLNKIKNGFISPIKGIKKTIESNIKRSKKLKGINTYIKTAKIKKKMSISAKNQQKHKCKYCHRFFIAAMLKRWHNENCKLKINHVAA